MWAAWLALFGCGDERELLLDGPSEVHHRGLGPVRSAPSVVLEDGSHPDDVEWTVERPDVARIEDGTLHAVGHGSTTVTGRWRGHTVHYRLVVEPAAALQFHDPPASLAMGQEVQLVVVAGEDAVPPDVLRWRSSHDDVLVVEPTGRARGVAPGRAWVTVTRAAGESAMVEIAVTR